MDRLAQPWRESGRERGVVPSTRETPSRRSKTELQQFEFGRGDQGGEGRVEEADERIFVGMAWTRRGFEYFRFSPLVSSSYIHDFLHVS
jgi:hypothetical protein